MCSLDWDIKYTILWLEESSQDLFKLKKKDCSATIYNILEQICCFDMLPLLIQETKSTVWHLMWDYKVETFHLSKKFSTNFSIDGEYALNETIPDWLAMVCKDFWTFQDHISNDHSMPASYMNNLW